MNVDDIFHRRTPRSGDTSKDSQKPTDKTVPSVDLPSPKSSTTNSKPGVRNSSIQLELRNGDPRAIRETAGNALIKVAEALSPDLTIEGKGEIRNFIDRTSRGYVGSLPMACRGDRCIFMSACPLSSAGAAFPIGLRCPAEDTIMAIWVTKHLKILGIENVDDPNHSFDMDLLYELAGQELIRWRCSVHLSDDPGLISNEQVGATPQGEPIFADVINPVLEIMEKAGKNVAKIRDALVATRKGQIAAGHDTLDPTQRAAELREKATKLQERRLKAKENVVEAEYTVKEDETGPTGPTDT